MRSDASHWGPLDSKGPSTVRPSCSPAQQQPRPRLPGIGLLLPRSADSVHAKAPRKSLGGTEGTEESKRNRDTEEAGGFKVAVRVRPPTAREQTEAQAISCSFDGIYTLENITKTVT